MTEDGRPVTVHGLHGFFYIGLMVLPLILSTTFSCVSSAETKNQSSSEQSIHDEICKASRVLSPYTLPYSLIKLIDSSIVDFY